MSDHGHREAAPVRTGRGGGALETAGSLQQDLGAGAALERAAGAYPAGEMDRAFFREVLRAYDSWVTRVYLVVRFLTIRRIILDLLGNLPPRATVLTLGSGIGLFDLYGARHRPQSRFIGIDIDPYRIEVSKRAAGRLRLSNVEFLHGDVTGALPDVAPDVIVALDILHHVPQEARDRLLTWSWAHLSPGGVLFVKDISTRVKWRVAFTRVLDDIMTNRSPTYYFSIADMRARLEALGFATTTFHLWDYVPFPHVIYIARK
jgi:2-polyprenyl-3-methyl-5-hydroxy-6-metoxy-1,4-benzoquinol methylase